MQKCRPGLMEYAMESIFKNHCYLQGVHPCYLSVLQEVQQRKNGHLFLFTMGTSQLDRACALGVGDRLPNAMSCPVLWLLIGALWWTIDKPFLKCWIVQVGADGYPTLQSALLDRMAQFCTMVSSILMTLTASFLQGPGLSWKMPLRSQSISLLPFLHTRPHIPPDMPHTLSNKNAWVECRCSPVQCVRKAYPGESDAECVHFSLRHVCDSVCRITRSTSHAMDHPFP